VDAAQRRLHRTLSRAVHLLLPLCFASFFHKACAGISLWYSAERSLKQSTRIKSKLWQPLRKAHVLSLSSSFSLSLSPSLPFSVCVCSSVCISSFFICRR
jgi:hypothetical protein